MYKSSVAKHPKTGRDIKIITTETHLSRNQKTMVWLRGQDNTSSVQRYDTIVTSIVDYKKYVHAGIQPLYIILSSVTEEIQDWLRTEDPANLLLCFVARKNLEAVGIETIKSLGHQNMVALEEMKQLYPQTGEAYEENEPISKTVIRVATVMQQQRLLGLTTDEIIANADYTNSLRAFGMEIAPYTSTSVPKHILLQQYYVSDKKRRYREIKKCLQENLQNPYIDEIWLLNEQSYAAEYPDDPQQKIREIVIGKRLTYAEVIRTIQTQVPPNTIVSFANSDIYYDGPSLRTLWSMDLKDTFLALLRYEESTDPEKPAQLFGPRADSQDAWTTWSTSVQSRQWDYADVDFPFGKGGCDNAITLCFFRQKFRVSNPALTLKTYHVHASEVRTYDKQDIVERNYMYVAPTGISDMTPMIDLTAYKHPRTPSITTVAFDRPIHCYNNAHLESFCTTLDKKERKTLPNGELDKSPRAYNANSPNTTTIPTTNVYNYQNAFMTNTGLAYLYGKTPLGNNDALKQSWSDSRISIIQPTLHTNSNAMSIYVPPETMQKPYKYLLTYIGQLLALQQNQQLVGDFWMPRSNAQIQALVQQCVWANQQIPVLPYEPHVQVYCNSVTQVTPLPDQPITREMVDALRTAYIGYKKQHENVGNAGRAVIFQDDAGIDLKDMIALEKALEACGVEVDVVYPKSADPTYLLPKLFGASYIIAANDASTTYEYMYWALPPGAHVFEIQQELNPRSAGIHCAGAARLHYWHMAMIRGSKDAVRDTLVKRCMETYQHALKLTSASTTPSTNPSTNPSANPSTLPLLIVPENQTGFQAHAGDSFREMAAIWADRGYVQLQQSSHTPFCWLGGIGDTLLYDRPNYDWYNQSPQNYKKALVGNPNPNTNTSPMKSAKSWSFWPRRPTYVEALVKAGIPNNPYNNRTYNCVFYGKIENATQAQKRSTQDWASVCDEWHMATNVNDPYKYTQEEYLRQLASSKYGLCLSGYGPKCHREIECMAMGTVPIVAPEVDMDNYANPPMEGVHYLRASSPNHAAQLLAAQTPQSWERMSSACKAWWAANASAEGMWKLTMELYSQ